jgi:hypothetical protein
VAVAGLKHAVAQAIKKKKSRQQKKHKSVFVSSHERKRKKMLLLQNAMCCFSVCFFKARLLRMMGVRLGFQPLLSLKGDAQAFKNAVCVRNLSGALVLATCFGNSVAKDGSAFSLPFKRKRQRKGENPSTGLGGGRGQ